MKASKAGILNIGRKRTSLSSTYAGGIKPKEGKYLILIGVSGRDVVY